MIFPSLLYVSKQGKKYFRPLGDIGDGEVESIEMNCDVDHPA
jgi:hypothetical protein